MLQLWGAPAIKDKDQEVRQLTIVEVVELHMRALEASRHKDLHLHLATASVIVRRE